MKRLFRQAVKGGPLLLGLVLLTFSAFSQVPKDVDPSPTTYMKVVIEESFETMMKKDMAEKGEVMERQMNLLERRYDLSDRPSKEVMMSGGRKPIQVGASTITVSSQSISRSSISWIAWELPAVSISSFLAALMPWSLDNFSIIASTSGSTPSVRAY